MERKLLEYGDPDFIVERYKVEDFKIGNDLYFYSDKSSSGYKETARLLLTSCINSLPKHVYLSPECRRLQTRVPGIILDETDPEYFFLPASEDDLKILVLGDNLFYIDGVNCFSTLKTVKKPDKKTFEKWKKNFLAWH